MKMSVDCLACFLKQAQRVAQVGGMSEKVQYEVVQEVSKLTAEMDPRLTPPENSIKVYETISRMIGCDDPYISQKKQANKEAMELLPELRREVTASPRPLETAIRLSLGGNLIDLGASQSFDLTEGFEQCRTAPLVIDDLQKLLEKVEGLQKKAKILYLADNCGEIVYDSLIMEYLVAKGFEVVVGVKKAPIINDATMEDALEIGLDGFCTVIDNGTNCPGTPLEHCSLEFLHHFHEAALVISKGQGNFETLSETEREIFFLLTVKCQVVGRHLNRLTGIQLEKLSGNGEMVVFQKGRIQ